MDLGAGWSRRRSRARSLGLINVRAWLASAGWASLCGSASLLFLAVSLTGLFVLFFGALISAMLAPLLLLLPPQWQWTGWQWLASGLAIWLAAVALLGLLARWSFVRCRAVVFVAPVGTWTRGSSVVAGVIAGLVVLLGASGLGPPLLPQGVPPPADPTGTAPVTV